MRTEIATRQPIRPDEREYAQEKLQRLEKHSGLHELRLTIDHDQARIVPTFVEVVAHVRHSHLVAKVDAGTVREGIDLVIDKIERQIARQKDKVTDHKGNMPANGQAPETAE